MSERRGTKGLELWCRRLTEGYPGVKVENMTTSWRNGLAFCAIIHHFRPDLIDFSKLNKDDIYFNNDLAFRTAEQYLGIPALLEPEDMVEFPVPDRLSILTYLSQFYQTFVVSQGSPSRIVPKRPATTSGGIVSPTTTSPASKVPRPSGGIGRREPCAKCNLPVFIAERLNVGKKLYHRTCFRCARCNSQLSLANYYETETENQFCCETCPDEVPTKVDAPSEKFNDPKSVLSRSLSDEEKSAGLQKFEEADDYSAMFETALEDRSDLKSQTLTTSQESEFTRARSSFFQSQLEDENEAGSEDDAPPHLPSSEPPPSLPKTKPPDKVVGEIKTLQRSDNLASVDKPKDFEDIVHSAQFDSYDSGYPSKTQSLDFDVNISAKFSDSSDRHQLETASVQLDNNKIVTKEIEDSPGEATSRPLSLVKSRMRLFENNTKENTQEVQTVHDADSVARKSSLELTPEVPSLLKDSTRVDVANSKIDIQSDINTVSSSSVTLDYELVTEDQKVEKHSVKDLPELEVTGNLENQKVEDHGKNVLEVEDPTKIEPETKQELLEDFSPKTEHSFTENITNKRLESVSLDTNATEIDAGANEYTKNETLKLAESQDDSVITISDTSNSDIKSASDVQSPPVIEISDEISQVDSSQYYPEELNPFDDEEDDTKQTDKNQEGAPPKPAVRKKVKPTPDDLQITGTNSGTPEYMSKIMIERISMNPFDEDEDVEMESDTSRKIITAPKISLNPFWSDGEDPEENENDKDKPVPLPRTSKGSVGTPEPKPRKSGLSISSGLSSTTYGSTTSLSSATSYAGHSGKKKKPAPPPPSSVSDRQDSPQSSLTSSPSVSVQHSPKLSGRPRKTKKAPLPPSSTSTPYVTQRQEKSVYADVLSIGSIHSRDTKTTIDNLEITDTEGNEWENEKIVKDEANRNRQSQAILSPTSSENSSSLSAPDKSTFGKWKRRKGLAPTRPIPQRRTIKPLPVTEIKYELEHIEIQQQGLEKQGVRLEQIIREKSEGPNVDLNASLQPEVEDLVLQLFELVNEKNDLFRRQAELMYLRRQQRLEEEYADLEYQIRCLMLQPEANKTDTDKAKEEELINRLVEVVERRNEIVECLEMDRVREAEEDDSINVQLNLYTSKREEKMTPKETKKEKKKHKKEKKIKAKGIQNVDVDKDIDECESSVPTLPVKEKKKKKFNIF